MKRVLFWLTVLAMFVNYTGGFSAGERWWRARSDGAMGGACRAFMEGGDLEREYLHICTDELLQMRTSDDADFRYSVARGIFFEALFDPERRAPRPPSSRQLRVALMAQWGGACAFALGSIGPVAEKDDVANATRIRACLIEMKRLRPRAWNALVDRHWRLANEADWTPATYPTLGQIERALDAENQIFGFAKRDLGWLGAGGVALAAAISARAPILALLVGLGERIGRRRSRSRSEHRWPPHEEPKAQASEPESPDWRMADAAFKAWFEKHFNPERGAYRTREVRARIALTFKRVVDQKHLRTEEQLRRHLRATFHPDAQAAGFTQAALVELSQYINQHLPASKAA